MNGPRTPALAVGATALLALAACGAEPATGEPIDTSDRSASTMAATTVAGADASTERIIPIDGDVAEVVFALGFGDSVVATDLSATYPPTADALPQIGYQRALTAEPIIDFDPTLVIGTDLAGPPETIDALRKVDIDVEIVPNPATPDGPATKIRAVADILGVPERGDELAAATDAEIAEHTVTDSERGTGPRVAVLYIRGDSVSNLLGDGMAIDWIVEATGAINVADELGVDEHAPISAEALVNAAPDVILATESGLGSVGGIDGLDKIPGVAGTPAGIEGNILAYDDQLMLGNGPRTGEFLAQLSADLATIEPGATS